MANWAFLCLGPNGLSLICRCLTFLAQYRLTKPRRFFLEISRLKRGCCVTCGYDLGYDFPRGCPECGWRRAESKETPTPKPRALQTSDPHMK